MANGAISNGRSWHGWKILERSWAFGVQEQAVSGLTKKDIVGREQTQLLGEKEEEGGSKQGWTEQAVNKSRKSRNKNTWWEREQLGKGKADAGREALRVVTKRRTKLWDHRGRWQWDGNTSNEAVK